MMKTLETKLRKMFRKKQREYFWLSIEGNEYKLVDSLPLNAYKELEKGLTNDEFYELASIFKEFGKEKILFAIFSTNVWVKRCCSNLRLFDDFSDRQLKEILCSADDILKLFLATDYEEDQYRLISLLDEEKLGNFLCHAKKEDYIAINNFLVWLCTKEENQEDATDKEKIADIFQKIASVSNAKLLENVGGSVEKRILKQLNQMNQDVLSMYKQISGDMLYDVLSKSDCAILEYADRELYSWIYANLSESAKVQFLVYLAEEKLDDIEFFDAEICAKIFAFDYADSWKVRFVKRVFFTRSIEDFNAFYNELSHEEKELMFEILLQLADKEGKEIVKALLKERNNLSLLEMLLNEKYVTN